MGQIVEQVLLIVTLNRTDENGQKKKGVLTGYCLVLVLDPIDYYSNPTTFTAKALVSKARQSILSNFPFACAQQIKMRFSYTNEARGPRIG